MRINQRFLVNKRSILALLAVLALMAMLATQVVWAQDEEDEPCRKTGDVVKCTYMENDTEPVVRIFATSPERDEVEFSVVGLDAADFTAVGGVLRFKKSPNFESPTDRVRIAVTPEEDNPDTEDVDETVIGVTAEFGMDNEYLVTVRATDVRPAGAKGSAPTSKVDVIVTVNNLNEDGKATIDWRQPEVGTELTGSASDPDKVDGQPVFEWSVPKVSRPTLTNDSHWQAPAATSRNSPTYTPEPDDKGKYLRLKASYDDEEGGDKDAYVRSDFRVRASVDDADNGPPTFETDAGVIRKIAETADVRDAVGNPVVASDPDQNRRGKADLHD